MSRLQTDVEESRVRTGGAAEAGTEHPARQDRVRGISDTPRPDPTTLTRRPWYRYIYSYCQMMTKTLRQTLCTVTSAAPHQTNFHHASHPGIPRDRSPYASPLRRTPTCSGRSEVSQPAPLSSRFPHALMSSTIQDAQIYAPSGPLSWGPLVAVTHLKLARRNIGVQPYPADHSMIYIQPVLVPVS